MKRELTIQEIAERTELSKRLLKINPLDWTDKDITDWVKAGYKLPKVLYDKSLTKKSLDNSEKKNYKKNK